jgi:hypothetical protein
VAATSERPDVDKLVALALARVPLVKMEGKRARIHRAFHDTSERFGGVFGDLCFSTQGSAPYSKVLEMVLFQLGNAGLLANLNPTFRTMSMEDDAKQEIRQAYEDEVGDFLPDELVEFLAASLEPAT